MIIRITTNNENDNQVLIDFMYDLPTYLHWEHDIFNKSYEENVKLKTKVRKILSKPVKSVTKKDKEVIHNTVMLEWNRWCAQHMNKRRANSYKALEGNFEVSISTRFTEKDEGNKVFYYFTKSGRKLRQ